ncbi:MAG: hypothetical protein IJI97_03025 [Clostridia bacterium]|nr:hypothetical protein [Clostridia bacterium]
MNGKDLKERLQAEGVNLSDLSKKMGYKTDQNLHSVLGAQDVRSGLLEQMSLALGKPIGWFYGEAPSAFASDHSVALTGGQYTNVPDSVIQLLAKKDEQIDRLLAIIDKLSK